VNADSTVTIAGCPGLPSDTAAWPDLYSVTSLGAIPCIVQTLGIAVDYSGAFDSATTPAYCPLLVALAVATLDDHVGAIGWFGCARRTKAQIGVDVHQFAVFARPAHRWLQRRGCVARHNQVAANCCKHKPKTNWKPSFAQVFIWLLH
jgi:hypothetical protein